MVMRLLAGAPVHEHAAGVEGAVRGQCRREVPHPAVVTAAAAARQRGALLQQPRRRRAYRTATVQRPSQAHGPRSRLRSSPAGLSRQRPLPPGTQRPTFGLLPVLLFAVSPPLRQSDLRCNRQ